MVGPVLDFSDQIPSPFHSWTLPPITEGRNKNFHFFVFLFYQNKYSELVPSFILWHCVFFICFTILIIIYNSLHFHLFVCCLSPQQASPTWERAGRFITQGPAQCLVHSRHSENSCWDSVKVTENVSFCLQSLSFHSARQHVDSGAGDSEQTALEPGTRDPALVFWPQSQSQVTDIYSQILAFCLILMFAIEPDIFIHDWLPPQEK